MILLLIWIALQIIVEILPISSSGHIALLQMIYSKYAHCNLEDYFARKNISIQTIYYLLHIPTLFIISFWFARDWYALFFSEFPHVSWPPILWLVIADGITVFFYFLIQRYKIFFPLLLGFIITALSLAITYFSHAPISINWSIASACIMGIAQSCAFLPGISRLAITCCAGYLYGYSLADAFFLSWLMQAPLMAAAIAKAVWHLSKDSQLQEVLNPAVVLVILGSSGISWMLLFAVKYSIFVHLWYLFAGYMLLPITILIWLTK